MAEKFKLYQNPIISSLALDVSLTHTLTGMQCIQFLVKMPVFVLSLRMIWIIVFFGYCINIINVIQGLSPLTAILADVKCCVLFYHGYFKIYPAMLLLTKCYRLKEMGKCQPEIVHIYFYKRSS